MPEEIDAAEAFTASIWDLVPLLRQIKERGEMKRMRVRIDIDLHNDNATTFEFAFNVWDKNGRTGETSIKATVGEREAL